MSQQTSDPMKPVFVIDQGIGWMRWPDGRMETAVPFEYVREIERLRAENETLRPVCKHHRGSGVIDDSGNGEFTCHDCGHVQKFGRGLPDDVGDKHGD